MHTLTDQLAAALLNKKNLAECSAEEIISLTKQYPYFSSAHLLLAAKNKSAGNQ
jgi:hypothetical protein